MSESEGIERYNWSEKGMKRHPQGKYVSWEILIEAVRKRIEAELKLNKYICVYGEELWEG